MFDKTIQKRRTIRRYTKEIPSVEIRREIVEAGLHAPTATNSQAFQIVDLSKEQVLSMRRQMEEQYEILLEKAQQTDNKKLVRFIRFYWNYTLPIFEAPVLWLVLGEKSEGFRQLLQKENIINPSPIESAIPQIISIGCVIQNMLLKATQLGLGSGVFSAPFIYWNNIEEKLLKEFGVNPEDYYPVEFLAFGYAEESPPRPKSKTVDEVYTINE